MEQPALKHLYSFGSYITLPWKFPNISHYSDRTCDRTNIQKHEGLYKISQEDNKLYSSKFFILNKENVFKIEKETIIF